MRTRWLVVLLLLTLPASGCGRLHFELLDDTAAGAGGAGSGGSSGVGGDGGGSGGLDAADLDAADLDAASDAASTVDAGPATDASTHDATVDTCGNGTLEAPEQCDDGADSVTCDQDCTFAACGDGTLNVSAGEGCDDATSPASCGASCQPLTCRTGCTCELYGGARYMFCAEQLDWAGARTACARDSMRPVRVESTTEQTWLRFRAQQDGLNKFHLGATDLNIEGTWVWDDGAAFWQGLANGTAVNGAFHVWAQGEPNSFVVGENCSEIQTLRGWNDCVCDIPKPVVCKEYRATPVSCGNGTIEADEACDDSGESAACDTDCSLAVCGDGRVNRARGEVCDDAQTGDDCSLDCSAFLCPAGCSCFDANGKGYALCSTVATFRDAAVLCGRAGMTLANAVDATIDQDLRSRATSAGIGELWIGGFDLDQPDNWVWSDLTPLWIGTAAGTAQGYAHFTAGAPSGMANRDCLAILPNGQWQDTDCTIAHAYACQRP